MTTYRIHERFKGDTGYAQLAMWGKSIPAQALGVILAAHELGATEKDVDEKDIREHINKNFSRLWPHSKKNTDDSIANTVSQYRVAMKSVPFMSVTIDNARGNRSPDELEDLGGGKFANPFRRGKKKAA